MFYTSRDVLRERIAAYERPHAVRTENRAAFEESAAETRAWLVHASGLDRCQFTPPNLRLLSRERGEGHTRERWLMDTEPGISMPYYVLIPDGIAPGERRPAILAPHGHNFGASASVIGLREDPVIAARIEKCNCDYGLQLVREGFVVFCPEARGMGDRREVLLQKDEALLATSCALLSRVGSALGESVIAMWTHDNLALAEQMREHPLVDPARMACVGLSGGGWQSMWLFALCPAMRAGVVSGYFYGADEALLEKCGNCDCNYFPGLWSHVDMADIAALGAPKPFFIETGDADGLNGKSGVANVLPQVRKLREVYHLYGQESAVGHQVFHGSHRWCGEDSIAFLKETLAR